MYDPIVVIVRDGEFQMFRVNERFTFAEVSARWDVFIQNDRQFSLPVILGSGWMCANARSFAFPQTTVSFTGIYRIVEEGRYVS